MAAGVLALISKSIFERDFAEAAIGSTLPIDHYSSAHPGLRALGDGLPLFLVTARPGDALWLVAVLPALTFKKGEWVARAPNTRPVTDLTPHVGRLAFENGKGLHARPGMLGMSLQTPRPLCADDVELLLAQGPARTAPKATPGAQPTRTSHDVTAQVTAAVRHAEAGDLRQALVVLLEAWRLVPASALADAIDSVSQRLPAQRSPLDWDKAAQSHRAELLGPVLATMLDGVAAQSMKRMALLSSWPADPRLDAWLVRMLDEVPFRATSTRPFWTRLVNRALELRDARGLATLERCRASYDRDDYFEKYLAHQVERVLEAAQPTLERHGALTLPEATLAQLARLKRPAPRKQATQRTARELLEAVWLEPENDALRLVLADVLQEEGDPRGELITLQREASPSPQHLRQTRKLVDAHFERLAGPLAGVVTRKHAVFRLGFLAEARVKPGNPRAVRALIGHPAWATVEVLEGPPEVALHPVMRSLRAVTVPKDESLEMLCEAGQANVTRLSCSLYSGDDDALTALKDCATLPSLVELSVDLEPDQATALLKGRLVGQLAVLHLRFSGSTAAAPGPSMKAWLQAARAAGVKRLEIELRRGELTHFGSRLAFDLKGPGKPSLELQLTANADRLTAAIDDLAAALEPFARTDLGAVSLGVSGQLETPGVPAPLKALAARLGAVTTTR